MNMRLAPHPLGAGASALSAADQTEVGDANLNLCHPAYMTGPTIAATTKDRTIPQAMVASA